MPTHSASRRRFAAAFIVATAAAAAFTPRAAAAETTVLSPFRVEAEFGLDGLRIAVLADFHYKPNQDDDLLHDIVEQIRETLEQHLVFGDWLALQIDAEQRVDRRAADGACG